MSGKPGCMILFPPDADMADVGAFRALWSRMRLEIVAMNPDPLRPIETDRQWMFDREADFYARRRPTIPVVLLVVALGVIVGILVAWAVR